MEEELVGFIGSIYSMVLSYRFLSRVFVGALPLRSSFASISNKIDAAIASDYLLFTPPSNVRTILSDVDGTLLNTAHILEDRTFNAIQACLKKGYGFFPCTGRSRKSMLGAHICAYKTYIITHFIHKM